MILVWLILIPLIGGVVAWIASICRSGEQSSQVTRLLSLIAVTLGFALSLGLWIIWLRAGGKAQPEGNGWWLLFDRRWIPEFGVSFLLGLDGLSLLMVVLTYFLGIVSVACSWTEIRERSGVFHLTLLWTIAGVVGVFLSLDLFLFYFFWELMLVPMYFLISIWGHENRSQAAIKFFIFTQSCSLLLLVAILALYFIHGEATAHYTFNYLELLRRPLVGSRAMWLMLGFFAAFAVKLPAVPLHPWLPDAHTEAPTAGSVLLAGIFLKTGAYGILRFVLPLFPEAAGRFAPIAMTLGVAGILYGALLSFAQTDLKRLVAYTSVSHLGFVLLGAFAGNEWALQGAVMVMICHALSTGALFVIVGALYERIHTRDMARMGGFWKIIPRLGGTALFFALASLGLPGLGNFVGEWLVLLGSFHASVLLTVIGSVGLVSATIYALGLVQKVFHGKLEAPQPMPDLSLRELSTLFAMVFTLVWLGVYPQPVFDTVGNSVRSILSEKGQSPSLGMEKLATHGGSR